MELKRGYKQTDVGVIPEEWKVLTGEEVCVKIQDGTHFSPRLGGNEYLYVTSKNIGFGFLDLSNADRIDASQHKAIHKRCDVRQGDLLLTKDGANTGNAALNNLEEEFSLLSSVAFLRFDPKKHAAGYFLQQILSYPCQQRIKDAMVGNAITRLTLKKIRKLLFPVAPLPEQHSIATALSDADELIGSLDRLIAKKRDLKQAAMQQLLTGQSRLPGFNAQWDTPHLGELFSFKNGLNKAKQFFGYGTPIVNYMDVYRNRGLCVDDLQGRVSLTREELSSFDVRKGDVFFTRTSETADEVGITSVMLEEPHNTVFSGFVLRARPKDDSLDDHFKKFCFSTYEVRRQITSQSTETTRALTNGRCLSAVMIARPPKEEQIAIATVLSDMDAEIAALSAHRDKIRMLKQGMMQELLSGRVRLVNPRKLRQPC